MACMSMACTGQIIYTCTYMVDTCTGFPTLILLQCDVHVYICTLVYIHVYMYMCTCTCTCTLLRSTSKASELLMVHADIYTRAQICDHISGKLWYVLLFCLFTSFWYVIFFCLFTSHHTAENFPPMSKAQQDQAALCGMAQPLRNVARTSLSTHVEFSIVYKKNDTW